MYTICTAGLNAKIPIDSRLNNIFQPLAESCFSPEQVDSVPHVWSNRSVSGMFKAEIYWIK